MSLLAFALLLAPCGTPQEPDLPFTVEGGGARYRRSLAAAQELARSAMPAPDELGPGWRRPWELPAQIQGGLSEAHFWRSLRPEEPVPHWFWFHGLQPREVRATVDKGLGQLREFIAQAEASGELNAQPELREFATVAGVMRLMTTLNRVRSEVIALSQPVYAVRHAGILDLMVAMSSAQDQTAQFAAMRALFEAFTPDLAGADEAAVLDAYVRQATLVSEWTGMTYFHAADADLIPDDENEGDADDETIETPPEMPDYGRFSVSMNVVRSDALGREVPLRSAADLSVLAAELEQHLASLAQAFAPDVSVKYRVTASPRELGDEAWILMIDADAALSGVPAMTGVFGRVRLGNAIIDVKGEGTYPREWLGRQLDYLLTSLAANNEHYSD